MTTPVHVVKKTGLYSSEDFSRIFDDLAERDKGMTTPWMKIETAPKGSSPSNPCGEHWVLGVNSHGEVRVIKWTHEYPCGGGVWMYAYSPSDYIDGMQTFDPVYWMPIPQLPSVNKRRT